jgi:hypothetical protein
MCQQCLIPEYPPSLLAIRQPVKVSLPFVLVCFLTVNFVEIAADSLKGRVFEISLADLQNKSSGDAWRKMKV